MLILQLSCYVNTESVHGFSKNDMQFLVPNVTNVKLSTCGYHISHTHVSMVERGSVLQLFGQMSSNFFSYWNTLNNISKLNYNLIQQHVHNCSALQ